MSTTPGTAAGSRPRSRSRIVAALAVAAFVALLAIGAWLVRTESKQLTWQSLLNATYTTSITPRGAALTNGTFEAEAAPGSASKITVRLADTAAFGDLDGNLSPDAAVVLVTSGGGSGTFVELAAVRNERGAARPAATALLGDRILVREVRIEGRRILVRLRARGATDPFSLRTREISRHYALDGNSLVLLDESEAEVQSTPAEDYVYRPERLDVVAGSSRSVGGSLAPGQIASYVAHGRAGEIVDLTARSDFDNAVLSVSGLTDGMTLVSRREYAVQRSLVLATEQDYAIKVVSLAGYQLPFVLQVGLRAASETAVPTARPTDAPLPSRTPSPVPTPSGAAGLAERPLGQVSASAAAFARSRAPIWGVAVVVPSRGVVFAENADTQVPVASIVKVLVLLVVLEQAREDHRPVSDDDLALLWPMITESDNDATSQLWERIGRGQAVSAYLRSVGVGGFTPDPGTSWGVSYASARAMAAILGKLLNGELLDAPSRALATSMLGAVVPEQRWGVTAGTDAASGDRVALKNGWYPGDEGWRVNSVGIVWPRAGDAYAIAIVTGGRVSWQEGITTIEGIAAPLNVVLRSAQ
ncbi:MAG TPA: serine hydrolase [Candidatus Saccharimonadales bacterium]|nr:serine hydrolase [Candidatus Saccharimonadales bacterium]